MEKTAKPNNATTANPSILIVLLPAVRDAAEVSFDHHTYISISVVTVVTS